jgi:hypothetical protein
MARKECVETERRMVLMVGVKAVERAERGCERVRGSRIEGG